MAKIKNAYATTIRDNILLNFILFRNKQKIINFNLCIYQRNNE